MRCGETVCGPDSDEARLARDETGRSGRVDLLTRVLARGNMAAAWKRVKANGGSAGVDGLTVSQSAECLKTDWPRIKEELRTGSYRPQPVRRVQIPKDGAGYGNWGYRR
jgi:RNA-directed DNA polymerase